MVIQVTRQYEIFARRVFNRTKNEATLRREKLLSFQAMKARREGLVIVDIGPVNTTDSSKDFDNSSWEKSNG